MSSKSSGASATSPPIGPPSLRVHTAIILLGILADVLDVVVDRLPEELIDLLNVMKARIAAKPAAEIVPEGDSSFQIIPYIL